MLQEGEVTPFPCYLISLKRLSHQFEFGYKWYGWIDHNWKRNADGFEIFSAVSPIFNLDKQKHYYYYSNCLFGFIVIYIKILYGT
jgi:hypothetical protein